MTQEERLNYLLEVFKAESIQYKDLEVEDEYENKCMVLRSLMNIRMPITIDEKVRCIQDEFLCDEAKKKGIVGLENMPTIKEQYESNLPFSNKITLWQGDITRLSVNAIVNAANAQMLGCFVPCHHCIDNAIHSAAGIELRAECYYYMKQKKIQYGEEYEEPTGEAMLTKGYNLPAEYVIHTVGPIVEYKLTERLKEDLRNCYFNVLKCCVENGIRSVALCCISTGEFHFPNEEAAKIAIDTVIKFLGENDERFDRIIFNVFKNQDKRIYEDLIKGK